MINEDCSDHNSCGSVAISETYLCKIHKLSEAAGIQTQKSERLYFNKFTNTSVETLVSSLSPETTQDKVNSSVLTDQSVSVNSLSICCKRTSEMCRLYPALSPWLMGLASAPPCDPEKNKTNQGYEKIKQKTW